MKKIVPFNNVLSFNTDVCEITAISLEHDITKSFDSISGKFYISGEYKMTDGQVEGEKFNFELPFDIALGCNYNLDTLVVDIDDFRYELVDDNKLKVNIDLYIDGEEVEDEPLFTEEELREIDDAKEEELEATIKDEIIEDNKEEIIEPIKMPITDNIDLLDEMLDNKEDNVKEEKEIEINNVNDNVNDNNNINIFNGINNEEQYVTYHVYPVCDGDTIDKILEKYNITKEEFMKYNSNTDIKTGDKLIIPANNNDK